MKQLRIALDLLDEQLRTSGVLDAMRVKAARRELGMAIGCAIDSIERGFAVGVSAKTFPVYPPDEDGYPGFTVLASRVVEAGSAPRVVSVSEEDQPR